MAWRFTGRTAADPTSPNAFGVCDRCSFWYTLRDLRWQFEWRGPRLVNIRIRVCPRCYDVPFIFNKPIIFPPDPIPVADPRPQQFDVTLVPGLPTPPVPTPEMPILDTDAGGALLDDTGQFELTPDEPAPFTPPVAGPNLIPLPWPTYPPTAGGFMMGEP